MKTNTKTKTVVLVSSLILSLSAITSYAKPSHTPAFKKQVTHKKTTPRAINHLPRGYKVVKHSNKKYYFVGNTCYIHTNRGFIVTTAPKNIKHHTIAKKNIKVQKNRR